MRSAALSWTQSSGGFLPKVFGHSCDCAETPSVDGKSRKACLTASALTGSVSLNTTCLILTLSSKLTSFPTEANKQNPREQLRVPAAIPHDKPRRAWDPLTWTLSGTSQRERPLRTGEAPRGADTAAAPRPGPAAQPPAWGGRWPSFLKAIRCPSLGPRGRGLPPPCMSPGGQASERGPSSTPDSRNAFRGTSGLPPQPTERCHPRGVWLL